MAAIYIQKTSTKTADRELLDACQELLDTCRDHLAVCREHLIACREHLTACRELLNDVPSGEYKFVRTQ